MTRAAVRTGGSAGVASHLALELRDGRKLGYAQYGDPSGQPVLFFHGFPGSRLFGKVADGPGTRIGVRLIALDRPGWGLSDFKPGRTVLDWADDVSEAADRLGIDRFAVLGLSGGGPYALVCAYRMPERVTAAGIVSGIGPVGAKLLGGPKDPFPGRLVSTLHRTWPPATWSLWLWAARVARWNPEWFLSRFSWLLPKADRDVVARPDFRRMAVDSFHEAFRQGVLGATYEMALNWRPWGFSLGDISVPVYVWQGEQDRTVPPSTARYVAAVIPNCQAVFLPGEGHASVIVDHMEEILERLTR